MFALLLLSHNDLAIPGPIPTASMKSEPVNPFRTEKMQRILSEFHTGLHPAEDEKLVAFITEESQQYGFEPELILALISTESSFYNWSVSKKGAVGMMQIIPETGKALAKATQIAWHEQNQRLFDPYVNIRLGIHYLHALYERFGDLRTALAAYNFGPTKIQKWIHGGKRIPTRYANKVLESYESYLASAIEENTHVPEGTSTETAPSIPEPSAT